MYKSFINPYLDLCMNIFKIIIRETFLLQWKGISFHTLARLNHGFCYESEAVQLRAQTMFIQKDVLHHI
mgnify:CR=1 FL=1